jgi:lactate dehydrogenase-like 2-hydroxyacid dehydrogenase
MTRSNQPKLFVLTAIPPDLRAALAGRYELAESQDVSGWPGVPARGFEVAITTSMHGLDRAAMDALPDLKIVLCNGAGLERIDLVGARERGVAVCHTPDELAEDVGDAAIALTYAIMRRVAEADRFVRAGRWRKERMTPSRRVGGKTMGIVGLGRIGRHVAKRAEGIGMKVIYSSRRASPDAPYPFVANILELAREADVLVLACPGNESTRHLVNREVLERLGRDGFLINVSRGSVVDEAALIEALRRKTIAGAALDVFDNEPNIDPAFLELENVVLQPHSTSITHETRMAMIARLLGDLDAFLAGRQFHNAAASPRP